MNEKKYSILVIEDDPDIRRLLSRALVLEGYETVLTGSADQALSQLANRLPDLILLDYRLPGMSAETFRRVHETHPIYSKVPIVLMSGERDLDILAIRFGIKNLVRKPIDLADLAEVISRAISEPAPAQYKGIRDPSLF